MKQFIALLLTAVMAVAVSAQTTPCPTTPTCDPRTQPDRSFCGPELHGREQLPSGQTGEWHAYWYYVGIASPNWLWCKWQWAALDKYAPKTPAEWWAIANEVNSASVLVNGIATALTNHAIVPLAGSIDEYEYKLLHYHACQALVASPPGGAWTTTPTCTAPVAPAPPPPPTVVWVVTPSATPRPAYPYTGSPPKRALLSDNTVVLGSTCDCVTAKFVEFNIVTYCTIPNAALVVASTVPHVTACSIKK